jgi:hypothetical protein
MGAINTIWSEKLGISFAVTFDEVQPGTPTNCRLSLTSKLRQ